MTYGSTYQEEVSVLGRLDMVRTTAASPSCCAGAPTSMWHRVSRWATRPSAVYVLHLTTLGSPYDDHAPARTRLAWEARVPIRGTLQHMTQRRGVV
jgi:hypothetical protein